MGFSRILTMLGRFAAVGCSLFVVCGCLERATIGELPFDASADAQTSIGAGGDPKDADVGSDDDVVLADDDNSANDDPASVDDVDVPDAALSDDDTEPDDTEPDDTEPDDTDPDDTDPDDTDPDDTEPDDTEPDDTEPDDTEPDDTDPDDTEPDDTDPDEDAGVPAIPDEAGSPIDASTSPEASVAVEAGEDACTADAECESNVCTDGSCVERSTSCSDQRSNGAETGVDCGGPDCAPCGINAECAQSEDCASCVCSDYGLCTAGNVGSPCLDARDCHSGICTNSQCAPRGVDCGKRLGGAGDVCDTNADCLTGECGVVCEPGAVGSACRSSADCTNENCEDGQCLPANPGSPCAGDSDCQSDECLVTGCGQGYRGAPCDEAQDCHASCQDLMCSAGGAGVECRNSSDCLSGDCADATCQLGFTGDGCESGGDCHSGTCEAEECSPGYVDTTCEADSDCHSDDCSQGACEPGPVGSACEAEQDCVTSLCNVNTNVCLAPLTLVSTQPTDNAGGVSASTNLVLVFSESVGAGVGNVTIRRASSGSLVESIPAGDARVTISGDRVTINPNSTLALLTEYYVLISAGAFVSLPGAPFAGIADPQAFSFTTLL